MQTGSPVKWRNENPNYVAYFYESGIVHRYLEGKNSLFAGLYGVSPATYDFSSDFVGKTAFPRTPTVEQIIANGYLAVPKTDPVEAIISDKKHTAWLGLDEHHSRPRYEALRHRKTRLRCPRQVGRRHTIRLRDWPPRLGR
jgi:hypothetical protein